MNTNKAKRNWIVDAGLFIGFLVAFAMDLTGLSLHQWLGVAVGAFALYHLLVHWDWVEAVSGRFFGRTTAQARLYYLVDAGLFLGFALIVLTGLVISTWFALPLGNYDAWKDWHVVGSYLTLLAVVLKIGLHWRWVVATGRRFFSPPEIPAPQPRSPRPAAPVASVGRRDFLKLMGVVGAAAALAAIGSLDSLVGAEAGQDSANQDSASLETENQNSTSTSTYRQASTSLSSQSSTACTIQCGKRCSYPGHCRRYVDTNGNGRCDLGECA